MNDQDRSCSSKKWYSTRSVAKHAAKKSPLRGLFPYQCRFCSGWHLSTRKGQEQGKLPPERIRKARMTSGTRTNRRRRDEEE